MITLRAGGATDVGLVRTANQDQYLLAYPLFAVADGMGGAAAGEVASAIAIETLHNAFARSGPPTPEVLITAAQAANRAVWDKAEAQPEMRGMGTTLVALALVDDGRIAIANVGDSRLYRFSDSELRQVTADHNLVAELVAEGRISKEEAEVHPRRNIMTRALGVEPEVPVDLFMEDARPGDRFVLCSDGLPREVSDPLIGAVLRRLGDPSEAASELVAEAKRRGGNDNITVVVVDVIEGEPPGGDGDEAAPVALADTGPPTVGDGDTMSLPVVRVDEDSQELVRAIASSGRPTGEDPAPLPVSHRPAGAFTVRVVGFILLLLLVVAAGVGGVIWYGRSSYFVGLRGSQIVIYQGRPGGVLWLQPTMAQVTSHTTAEVLPAAVGPLRSGQEEPTLAAARAYLDRLLAAKQAATGTSPTTVAPSPASTAPTTTVP